MYIAFGTPIFYACHLRWGFCDLSGIVLLPLGWGKVILEFIVLNRCCYHFIWRLQSYLFVLVTVEETGLVHVIMSYSLFLLLPCCLHKRLCYCSHNCDSWRHFVCALKLWMNLVFLQIGAIQEVGRNTCLWVVFHPTLSCSLHFLACSIREQSIV